MPSGRVEGLEGLAPLLAGRGRWLGSDGLARAQVEHLCAVWNARVVSGALCSAVALALRAGAAEGVGLGPGQWK